MAKKMRIIKWILMLSVLIMPIWAKSLCAAEETFEQHLKGNEKIKERYDAAKPEEQAKMKENWEKRKEKLANLSEEEKKAAKIRELIDSKYVD